MAFIKTFFVLGACLLVLDVIWLKFVAYSFFQKHVGQWMRPEGVKLLPAFFAYVLMALGLTVFVLPLCKMDQNVKNAAFGFLFGLIMYGVFDLTTHAIFPTWPVNVLIVDMIWGSCLCAISTLIAFKLIQ